jgi:hypothetical protein
MRFVFKGLREQQTYIYLLSSTLPAKHINISSTAILLVVLYGCETWSLTLREEHKQKAFKNRAPRTIFGPVRNEATGEWRRLRNEERHDLYASPNVRVINQEE